MVIRHRTISKGFYDFQIQRYVESMTLKQAALNLDIRHKMVTGEDQHIEKRTLDDHYYNILKGCDTENPFDYLMN